MTKTLRRGLFLASVELACLAALPSAARAQSAIAGVVKDSSGAVLPGVSVEVASDALIEKTRTVTTDGSGLYKIIDLRPGVYTVTVTQHHLVRRNHNHRDRRPARCAVDSADAAHEPGGLRPVKAVDVRPAAGRSENRCVQRAELERLLQCAVDDVFADPEPERS